MSTCWPTYVWQGAPPGLATTRQLRVMGRSPAGAEIVGQIVWRERQPRPRVAYLYRIVDCGPRRPPTPQQAAALAAAMRARRTCPVCTRDIGYCLPRRWTACLDCQDPATQGASRDPSE